MSEGISIADMCCAWKWLNKALLTVTESKKKYEFTKLYELKRPVAKQSGLMMM